MRMFCGLLAALALFVCPASRANAQTASLATGRDVLIKRWNEIGAKIMVLAEGFPEDKYDYRPGGGARSFAEQLRHVAFWNQFVAESLAGEAPDATPNELPSSEYPTKASLIAVLRSTTAGVADRLARTSPTPDLKTLQLLVTFIEHSGEHYGQLVLYYRLNGLVPPESRTQ
jgi:hypothetical protein